MAVSGSPAAVGFDVRRRVGPIPQSLRDEAADLFRQVKSVPELREEDGWRAPEAAIDAVVAVTALRSSRLRGKATQVVGV